MSKQRDQPIASDAGAVLRSVVIPTIAFSLLPAVLVLPNGEERHIGIDVVSRLYLGNFPGGTTAANLEYIVSLSPPQTRRR